MEATHHAHLDGPSSTLHSAGSRATAMTKEFGGESQNAATRKSFFQSNRHDGSPPRNSSHSLCGGMFNSQRPQVATQCSLAWRCQLDVLRISGGQRPDGTSRRHLVRRRYPGYCDIGLSFSSLLPRRVGGDDIVRNLILEIPRGWSRCTFCPFEDCFRVLSEYHRSASDLRMRIYRKMLTKEMTVLYHNTILLFCSFDIQYVPSHVFETVRNLFDYSNRFLCCLER